MTSCLPVCTRNVAMYSRSGLSVDAHIAATDGCSLSPARGCDTPAPGALCATERNSPAAVPTRPIVPGNTPARPTSMVAPDQPCRASASAVTSLSSADARQHSHSNLNATVHLSPAFVDLKTSRPRSLRTSSDCAIAILPTQAPAPAHERSSPAVARQQRPHPQTLSPGDRSMLAVQQRLKITCSDFETDVAPGAHVFLDSTSSISDEDWQLHADAIHATEGASPSQFSACTRPQDVFPAHETSVIACTTSLPLDPSRHLSFVPTTPEPASKFPCSFSTPDTPEYSNLRLSAASHTTRVEDAARLGSHMSIMPAAEVPSLQTYSKGLFPFILSPGDKCTEVVLENALVGNGTTVQRNTKDAWFKTDVARGAQVADQHLECDAFRAVTHAMKRQQFKASTDARCAPCARVTSDRVEEIMTAMSTVNPVKTRQLCRLAEFIATLQEPGSLAILSCPPSFAASSDASTFSDQPLRVFPLGNKATAHTAAIQRDVNPCRVSTQCRALSPGDASADVEVGTRMPDSRSSAHRTDACFVSTRTAASITLSLSSVNPGQCRMMSPGDASEYAGAEVQPVLHAYLLVPSRQASVLPSNHSRSDGLPSLLGDQDIAAWKPLLQAPADVRCARGARVASERTEGVPLNSWMTSCLLACTGDVAMYSYSGLPVDAHIATADGCRLSPARAAGRNAPAAVLAMPTVPGNISHASSTSTRIAGQLAPSFSRKDAADGATQSGLLSHGDASRSSQSSTIVEHKTFAAAPTHSTVLDKSPRLSSVSTASAPASKSPGSFSAPVGWMSPGDTPECLSLRLSSALYTNQAQEVSRLESRSGTRTVFSADIPVLQTYSTSVIPLISSLVERCTDVASDNAHVRNGTALQQNTKTPRFETVVAPGAPVPADMVVSNYAMTRQPKAFAACTAGFPSTSQTPPLAVRSDAAAALTTRPLPNLATFSACETPPAHLCALSELCRTTSPIDVRAAHAGQGVQRSSSAIHLRTLSPVDASEVSSLCAASSHITSNAPESLPAPPTALSARVNSAIVVHSSTLPRTSSPRITRYNAADGVPASPPLDPATSNACVGLTAWLLATFKSSRMPQSSCVRAALPEPGLQPSTSPARLDRSIMLEREQLFMLRALVVTVLPDVIEVAVQPTSLVPSVPDADPSHHDKAATSAPAALKLRLYGVALQRASTTRRCSVTRDKSRPTSISSTRMLFAVGNLLAGAIHSERNARKHVLLDAARVRRAPGAGVAMDKVALSSGRLDARRSHALSRSDTLCDVQAVVCIPVPSAYDLGGMPVVAQLSRTYSTRGNAHSRKFAPLHGQACASHSEGGHPYITPTDKENIDPAVDPCFRTDPKSRKLSSSILKSLLSPDATARPPSSALAAFPKTRDFHGPVRRWLVAGIEANLLSPGDAGTSATTPRVVVQLLPHAFSTRDSHVKLDVLVALTERLGSAASSVLSAVLMIKFFTELGRNTIRTQSEEASNFVDILIIAITLMVVAVLEGLPLAVTFAVVLASRRMTGQNQLVHVLSPCDIITDATIICTHKKRTLTQSLMTVVVGSVSVSNVKQDAKQNLESDGGKSKAPPIIGTDPSLAERRVDQSKLDSFYSSAPDILTKRGSTHIVAAKPGETPSQDDHIESKEIGEFARDNMQCKANFNANQSFKAYESNACEVVDMVLNERKTTDAAREAPNASLLPPSSSPISCQRADATACLRQLHLIATIPSLRADSNTTCVLRTLTRVNTRRSDSSRLVARPYNLSRPPTALPVAADSVEPAGSSSEPSGVPAGPVAPTVRQRAAATLSMGNHWSAASALPACAARSSGPLSPKHLVVRVFPRTRTSRAWKGRRAFIPPSLHVPAASNNITCAPTVQSALQRALSDVVRRSVPVHAVRRAAAETAGADTGNAAYPLARHTAAALHPARLPSVSTIHSRVFACI